MGETSEITGSLQESKWCVLANRLSKTNCFTGVNQPTITESLDDYLNSLSEEEEM